MIFDVTGINESRIIIPKKVQSEPGSDRFSYILNIANTDPDLRFSSAISLNFDPNLGRFRQVQGRPSVQNLTIASLIVSDSV
jgi:hypothetical protein